MTVVLKLVQVYIVDKKGHPVSDLRKEDFVVTDNGRPVDLTEFEKHTLAPPVPVAAGQPADIKTKTEEPALLAPIAPPALSRKFFLLFDLANTNQRGARKAKDAALHFLDAQAEPNDEIGLITYSLLRGLSIREFLTPDHAKIRAAVVDLSVKETAGRAEDIEQEYWRKAAVEEPDPTAMVDLEWRRQETKNQALNYILKLTYLAKGLRYVPGRKNILLFSSGIPNSLIYGNQAGNPQGTIPGRGSKIDTGDRTLRTQNEEMLKEMSSSNCSIFTFDIREGAKVATLFDYDAETFATHSRDSGRSIFTTSGVHQNNDMVFKDENVTGQYSLGRLAKTTGGKYFSNINEYRRNLDDLQNITGTYYVLGYSINQAWDGRFHTLKVDVRRKGMEVRAQSGYFNPKPFREYSDMEKNLQFLDLAMSETPLTQTPVRAPLTALAGPGGGTAKTGELTVLTELPPSTFNRLTGTRAEIITLIFKENDELAEMHRSEEALTRFKDKSVILSSQAALAPGAYKLRVIVRDLDTGEAAVGSGRAFIPSAPAAGISLHTPLLLAPGSEEIYVEGRAKTATDISWTLLYPFDRGQFRPVFSPLAKGTPKVIVFLPCLTAGIDDPRIALRASLVDESSGAWRETEFIPAGRTALGNTITQVLAIPVAGLAAGKYRIHFYAEETKTRALSHASIPLTIR